MQELIDLYGLAAGLIISLLLNVVLIWRLRDRGYYGFVEQIFTGVERHKHRYDTITGDGRGWTCGICGRPRGN